MVRRFCLPLALFALFTLASILVSARAVTFDPAASAAVEPAGASSSRSYAAGRVLVKFLLDPAPVRRSDGTWQTGSASLDRLLADSHVQAASHLFSRDTSTNRAQVRDLERIYVLQLAQGSDVLRAVRLLSADPGVAWVEPDYLAFPAATTPDDPLFPQQWGLSKIEAPSAWDVVTGTATVAIAVVDSGIDFSHPDLAAKIWANPGEIPGNGIDDDNNGFVDDVNGWDFVNADADPADDYGHGTQVAGVAATASNNGMGVAGACWGCRVMPVKVMQASGVANYSDVAAGVMYAAQKGARAINLSLGGYSDSFALRTAVEVAVATYDAVIVAGAGNDGASTPFYPAAYDAVLGVAGTDPSDAKAVLSNYGDWVGISAPAVAITTTFMGGDYGPVDGTSTATAFVSGIAGLLRSHSPDWSSKTAQAQVIHTADDIDGLNPGFEGQLGRGRANAGAAVSTVPQPLLQYDSYLVDGVANGRPEPGSTVDLHVTLYNDWYPADNVQGVLSSSDPLVTVLDASASLGNIPTYATASNVTPFRFSLSASAPYGHSLGFTLHLTAGGGWSADIPMVILAASPVVYPPATITTQTWTNDRVYVINKESGIPAGETLTIEPGTEIHFDGLYSLTVGGTLIADGSSVDPILFTSHQSSPAPGDWGQIHFLDSSVDATFDGEGNYLAGSILRHTIVEYGQGVELWLASPYIAHNLFQHFEAAYGAGLVTQGETVRVEGNTLLGAGIKVIASAGTIARNAIRESPGPGIAAERTALMGIAAGDALTITQNTVQNNATGIWVQVLIPEWHMSVGGNLVAHNEGNGVWIAGGAPVVVSNTVVHNGRSAVYIEEGAPALHHNNLVAGPGQYALRHTGSSSVDATGNWWETADENEIQEAIYDGLDEFGLGLVDYGEYLLGPAAGAPAYVSDVHISPDTTLGIQTATFDVEFSRPMEQDTVPQLSFRSVDYGTWTVYNTSNSGLPDNDVNAVATALDGSVWFGTSDSGVAYFDRTNWTVYNTSNSGLPADSVYAIATDPDGTTWFGTGGAGVARFNGTDWTVYNPSNSGLPADSVYAIATDPDGSHWFGTTSGGVAHLDGTNWTIYNSSNSPLPTNYISAIATAPDGSHWFGTSYYTIGGGVTHFDGINWTVYDTSNSGLPNDLVSAITTDSDGSAWFATRGDGVAHFDGTNWTVYNPYTTGLWYLDDVSAMASARDRSLWLGFRILHNGAAHYDGCTWTYYDEHNSGYPGQDTLAIAVDGDDSPWFGTLGGGVAVYWNLPSYPVEDNAQWLDDHTFRATYDITSLIPRGDYLVTVSGATGTDGIEIASTAGYTFTIDYAGAVGDTTPPPIPSVEACASTDASTLSASWSAFDPDSAITLYSYAIGATPGGTEVINWTNTSDLSFARTGLGLIGGETYYVAVKARNEGGLWSAAAIPDGVVAGSGTCTTNIRSIYLPVVFRGN